MVGIESVDVIFESRCEWLIRSRIPATAIGIGLPSTVILFQRHWHMQTSNISIESPEIANATGDEAKTDALSRLTARMRQRQVCRIHQAVAWLSKLYAVIPFGRSTPQNSHSLLSILRLEAPGMLFTQGDKAAGSTSGSALISTFRSFACMEALHKGTLLEVIFSVIKTVMLLIWDLP